MLPKDLISVCAETPIPTSSIRHRSKSRTTPVVFIVTTLKYIYLQIIHLSNKTYKNTTFFDIAKKYPFLTFFFTPSAQWTAGDAACTNHPQVGVWWAYGRSKVTIQESTGSLPGVFPWGKRTQGIDTSICPLGRWSIFHIFTTLYYLDNFLSYPINKKKCR